ncbi:MAG: beta-hydroxyacyl-ACP dehydratase [Phycisphaerales bacterium]|nr:beta-hydroxyacyl-ACP dehydratase [Phycisphaerales bacterium]
MRWMWIDRVIELVPAQKLVAIKNVSLAEEHLQDHFPADGERGLAACPVMPACFIIEGMAQTGGILVGHSEGFKFNVVLAKISRVELQSDAIPGDTLKYTASVERMDAMGATIKGVIERLRHADEHRAQGGVGAVVTSAGEGSASNGWQTIGSVEMMFSHLDNNMGAGGQAGRDFPEGNFVFGESFKTLLRCSGY